MKQTITAALIALALAAPSYAALQVGNGSGATNITSTSAYFTASVISTGVANPTVSIYWGTNDGGTNAASWGNTNSFGEQGVGGLSTQITSLSAYSLYYYRARGSDTAATNWANYSVIFRTLDTGTTAPAASVQTVTTDTDGLLKAPATFWTRNVADMVAVLTGLVGQAASITVGYVSNGVAGTDVIITNTGSATNAILNFVIPIGAAGANGTNGADGADGATGPAGPVTNQVITYAGVVYTITNDPSAEGDVLYFDPATSNAWFAPAAAASGWSAHAATQDVIIGQSVEQNTNIITVSGAGLDPAIQGDYGLNGDWNGFPRWSKDFGEEAYWVYCLEGGYRIGDSAFFRYWTLGGYLPTGTYSEAVGVTGTVTATYGLTTNQVALSVTNGTNLVIRGAPLEPQSGIQLDTLRTNWPQEYNDSTLSGRVTVLESPYQAWTVLNPGAGETCTIAIAHGSLVSITATNGLTTIEFNNAGYSTQGVSRVAVELWAGTNSIAFNSASITNSTAPTLNTNAWNSLFFRRTAGNAKWEGRQ
jgi:hypothetical protein